MSSGDLAHLELLAEIDALARRLQDWSRLAPPWRPAETCQAIIGRLEGRLRSLRIRLESPLIVATLGGTGTGKSSLINALAGAEVVRSGRGRPTTTRPALLCRPGLTPEILGMSAGEIDLVPQDLPALANLVLVDCPDPDTTDAPGPLPADTTLARLRRILPQCDVLIVTTTQQKYRSARVAEELAAAAPGARLVFVQTHADQDADVRDDWRRTLDPRYQAGHIFFVDSVAALADAQQGRAPQGEFAALVDLLTRQFAGAAAARIRRANFLDLAARALESCRRRLDEAMPTVENLSAAIEQQRGELSSALAGQIRGELLSARRPWENRLLGQVASRWGFSPFALVLRLYQGIGGLASGALLYRADAGPACPVGRCGRGSLVAEASPQPPIAAAARPGGGRRFRSHATPPRGRRAGRLRGRGRPAQGGGLRRDPRGRGRRGQLGLRRPLVAGPRCPDRPPGPTAHGLVHPLALRDPAPGHAGLSALPAGKEFLLRFLVVGRARAMWGVESYIAAAFWFVLWCLLLLWLFTRRLRGGLRQAVDRLAATQSTGATAAAGVCAELEDDCRRALEFRRDLELLQGDVERLRGRV